MMPPSPGRRLVMDAVRTWTHVYTLGLPAEASERRLDEIESDLWESRHDSTGALAILGRLLRGIPDDVQWRVTVTNNQRSGRWAFATMLGVALVVSSLWLALHVGDRGMPRPPASPDLVTRRVNYPPPPPPPPPPCNPPGIGRPEFKPCTPF